MATIAGHLVAIGGAEDREPEGDKAILRRVVQLSGGAGAHILVLTTASQEAEELGAIYLRAFVECGAQSVTVMHIDGREMADDPAVAQQLSEAGGIFMTGGDQSRLAGILGGTGALEAMRHALQQGACVAGTSAGASAVTARMVAGGESGIRPKKGMLRMGLGLGFLPKIMVDQHFTERQRLGRLLTAVAQHPTLIGVGIDEDTAIVMQPDRQLEVIGRGAVTMIDGQSMQLGEWESIEDGSYLTISHVTLHLLPAGFRFSLADAPPPMAPRSLGDVIKTVVATT